MKYDSGDSFILATFGTNETENKLPMKGSRRLNSLSESQTLALTKLVRELKAEGKDIIGLTLGEPDFDTPVHIRNAGIEAIRESFTHYPPVAGIPELRAAIAKKFRDQNGLNFQAENIVVSTGAKQSLVNAILSLVDPKEELILIAPFWVSYMEMAKMASADIKIIQTGVETGYKVTLAQLEATLNENTRMIVLNSPNNPTGSMYSREELEAMADLFARYPDLYILTDEIYEYLAYDEEHFSIGSIPSIADRVITVNGFSKGFAMTGWRIGYLGATKWIAELCEKYQGQITSGANSIAQKACLEAISSDLTPTYEMRDKFRQRRDTMFADLSTIKGIKISKPEGAFYLYPDLSNFLGKTSPKGETINDIDHLVNYLIQDGGVALIPGTAFGTESHVRISYAYSTDLLKEGAKRIKNALEALQ